MCDTTYTKIWQLIQWFLLSWHKQYSCRILISIKGFKWRARRREAGLRAAKNSTTHQPVKSPTPPTHSLDRLSRGEQESRDWVALNES